MARNSIFFLFAFLLLLVSINPSLEFDVPTFARNHLKAFGYLSEDYTPADDSYDEALSSALKTYQTFYQLNITGRIDPDTLTSMIQPRCGVPDLHSTDHVHNITPNYNFFPGNLKWPPSKRSLSFGFISPLVLPIDTMRAALLSAFSKWSAVTKFTFHELTDESGPDLKIGFYKVDGPRGIVANSFPPTGGELHFDGDEQWSVNPTSSEIDLESISLHEIGHLLGLDHSSDKSAVMFATYIAGEIRRVLQPDDINGIHALYPDG